MKAIPAIVLLWLTLAAFPAVGGARTVICAAEIARACSRMETNVHYSVEATVTFRPQTAVLGIADASGTATLTDYHHNRFEGIRAGDRVQASGFTKISTNSLIPTAYCERISVLSHGNPPSPVDVTASEFHSGRFDNAYVRVRGVVRDVFVDEIDAEWRFLVVSSEQGSVFAAFFVDENKGLDLERLEGADVAVSGLCGKLRVDRRPGSRHALRRILSASGAGSIEVLRPSPENPYDAPVLGSAKDSSPEEIAIAGRRRIAGRVLAVWGGRHVMLGPEGRDGVVQCDLRDGAIPKLGDFIEAVGFPETDLFRINLARAIWRKAEATATLREEPPEDISAEQLFMDENGKPGIQTKFHGRLVRVHGIVRSLPAEGSLEQRIYIECGNFTLPMDISAIPSLRDELAIGCEISAAGICVAKADSWSPHSPFPHIQEVFLVPREPSDVAVLRNPPWWTPQRLFVAIASLLFVILVILIWNLLLRRLAERRGRQLAEELVARAETDMKVLERTRLAVELHDSVAQNLAGVAMELETARQFQEGAHVELIGHLNTAFRTLKSCRDELRNCLWDLRSQSLEEPDMETAIRRTLTPHVKGVSLAVRFNVPRAIISDNTTHALLCIIRELVVNGIRHGKASSIKIAGGIEDDALRFSVRDDGCGFDPERCPGIESGHYGLQGIRERVSRLGGRMSVESSPGAGTKATITIHIPKGQPQAEDKT